MPFIPSPPSAGVLIALLAMRLGDRKSSPARTFGYIRAEILGALFNGLFLVGMALYVLWMGAMRLMQPIELATTPMLVAATGGIATELVALWLLYQRQKGNLNMRAPRRVMRTGRQSDRDPHGPKPPQRVRSKAALRPETEHGRAHAAAQYHLRSADLSVAPQG